MKFDVWHLFCTSIHFQVCLSCGSYWWLTWEKIVLNKIVNSNTVHMSHAELTEISPIFRELLTYNPSRTLSKILWLYDHLLFEQFTKCCIYSDSNEAPCVNEVRLFISLQKVNLFRVLNLLHANPSNFMVWVGVGLCVWILAGRGCLSLVSVGCCQMEVSVLGCSLVQTQSPTKCDVFLIEWYREASKMRRPPPTRGCCTMGG
jgi:hypothetical protein